MEQAHIFAHKAGTVANKLHGVACFDWFQIEIGLDRGQTNPVLLLHANSFHLSLV
jgi:hypothetical protein